MTDRPERKPYQLCTVQFLTFKPSVGGVVNTTDVDVRTVQWWVPQVTDDAVANDQRAVEAAIKLTRGRFDVLGVVGAGMTDQIESTICNQPARPGTQRLSLADAAGLRESHDA